MPNGDRDDAERPGEADAQGRQHQERLDRPPERDEQYAEGEDDGQERRHLAVSERHLHLVTRQGRTAGDANLDRRKLRTELRDVAADLLDGSLVARRAARVAERVGKDEEKTLVLREEIAGVCILRAEREEGAPRRPVRARAVGASGDLLEQRTEDAEVG